MFPKSLYCTLDFHSHIPGIYCAYEEDLGKTWSRLFTVVCCTTLTLADRSREFGEGGASSGDYCIQQVLNCLSSRFLQNPKRIAFGEGLR